MIYEIYFSATGTTESLIKRISSSFEGEKITYNLLKNPPTSNVEISNSDLVLIGMPVYAGRIPKICIDMLKHFKASDTPTIATVVYGNRAYDDALLELSNLLSQNNFLMVTAGAFVAQHSIFPEVGTNRPDQDDFTKIDNFSKRSLEILDSFSASAYKSLNIKGNFPYLDHSDIPIKPSGNSKCTSCGICSKICPTKAIDKNFPKKTNKKICISCAACIAYCPEHARGFHGPIYEVAKKSFVKKNSIRKEPEFFYT